MLFPTLAHFNGETISGNSKNVKPVSYKKFILRKNIHKILLWNKMKTFDTGLLGGGEGRLRLESKWKCFNEHKNCIFENPITVCHGKVRQFLLTEIFFHCWCCATRSSPPEYIQQQFVLWITSDDFVKAIVLAAGFCLARCLFFCGRVTV